METRSCPRCGKSLEENTAFCQFCYYAIYREDLDDDWSDEDYTDERRKL